MSEVIAAIEKVSAKVEEYKTQLGNKADKDALELISKQIDKLAKIDDVQKFDALFAKITKQLEEVAEDVQATKNQHVMGGPPKSLGQLVVDKMKELGITSKMGKGTKHNFEIIVDKVPATMVTANVLPVTAGAIPWSLTDVEGGLTRAARRRPYIISIANVATTTKMYVGWAEQINLDGAAGWVAEGAKKPQIDFDWQERVAKVEKCAAFIKVSKEALDDIDGLRAEIDSELREQVELKIDDGLYNGTGVSPELRGLKLMDTAYAAGSFALSVVGATKADVLRTAIAQVYGNGFIPNYALVMPDDLAAMDLAKGSDGHYSLPPFRSADGMQIAGVTVIPTTIVGADQFTVGDFTKLNIRIREEFNIEVGYENDDFTKNLVTILGEKRLVSYVKVHHYGAFVTGDFSDSITAINKVGTTTASAEDEESARSGKGKKSDK
jgi:HK97 family phage major capsid protein